MRCCQPFRSVKCLALLCKQKLHVDSCLIVLQKVDILDMQLQMIIIFQEYALTLSSSFSIRVRGHLTLCMLLTHMFFFLCLSLQLYKHLRPNLVFDVQTLLSVIDFSDHLQGSQSSLVSRLLKSHSLRFKLLQFNLVLS